MTGRRLHVVERPYALLNDSFFTHEGPAATRGREPLRASQ